MPGEHRTPSLEQSLHSCISDVASIRLQCEMLLSADGLAADRDALQRILTTADALQKTLTDMLKDEAGSAGG